LQDGDRLLELEHGEVAEHPSRDRPRRNRRAGREAVALPQPGALLGEAGALVDAQHAAEDRSAPRREAGRLAGVRVGDTGRAMSQANVELVRRNNEAYNARDVEA